MPQWTYIGQQNIFSNGGYAIREITSQDKPWRCWEVFCVQRKDRCITAALCKIDQLDFDWIRQPEILAFMHRTEHNYPTIEEYITGCFDYYDFLTFRPCGYNGITKNVSEQDYQISEQDLADWCKQLEIPLSDN